MSQVFTLPDVGEGLTEADILAWKVSKGDTVSVNQVLVEIETAKSVVELPSPYAGTVQELMVAEGDTVDVGTPIITVSSGDDAPAGGTDPGYTGTVPQDGLADASGSAAGAAASPEGEEQPQGQALVGSGPKADPVRRRRRNRPASGAPQEREEAPAQSAAPVPAPADVDGGGTTAVTGPAGGVVPRRPGLAKPPVRKAAREMGIDLADVEATGEAGQVTKRDLLAHAERSGASGASSGAAAPVAVRENGERVERIKVKGVRKATAQNMVKSAFTAPHVSIFVEVDATRTMEFVKRLKQSPRMEGVKISPLLIVAKAVIWAAERNPDVNATWSDTEIIVKHFMNLGIAAATPRGLLVPNIKDAQDLSLRDLAVALQQLTETARAGRTQPAEMQGGTLSITNIGVLGADTGTPIINPGESGILAFGAIKQKPWVMDGEVVPRWITTLSGSFDHRVVDGELAARFMSDVARIVEEPALLLE
ncbi:dihydrolipoamide acetyltransferase family protein [Kocuria sp. KSNUG]|uniref:dihydrolipoamide acetyltransferase family protein n=1 Tax=Kocuria sp. KSNUG TaxID=3136676 RepID=UPI003C2AD74B